MDDIVLREAVASDARRIFAWRNDPWIVSLSENRHEVTWQEHEAWFTRVLASPDHLLFALEVDGEGAGTTRLDRGSGDTAVITVYLLKPWIGRGLGTKAIIRTSEIGFERWPGVATIEAHVRQDNAPSLAAFTKAGFSKPEKDSDPQSGMIRLLRKRSESD